MRCLEVSAIQGCPCGKNMRQGPRADLSPLNDWETRDALITFCSDDGHVNFQRAAHHHHHHGCGLLRSSSHALGPRASRQVGGSIQAHSRYCGRPSSTVRPPKRYSMPLNTALTMTQGACTCRCSRDRRWPCGMRGLSSCCPNRRPDDSRYAVV